MRSFDTVYLIDGSPMLVPDAGVEISLSDLDGEGSGRDAAGFLHRRVLRTGMRTWGFTYGVLTAEELNYMQDLFANKSSFAFTCERGTVTAYCDRQDVTLFDRSRGLYKAFKFAITEC